MSLVLALIAVFQTKSVETVIARLFYSKPHNWEKEMTFTEFKKTEFYECLLNLERIEDVNAVCFAVRLYCLMDLFTLPPRLKIYSLINTFM